MELNHHLGSPSGTVFEAACTPYTLPAVTFKIFAEDEGFEPSDHF